MSVQFTISITKEVLKQSKDCGHQAPENGSHCAIAIALKDIFPDAYVAADCVYPFGNTDEACRKISIPLPPIARQFVKLFDGFYLTPGLRLLLPAFEFPIELQDEVIDMINIDEVRKVIQPPALVIAERRIQQRCA